MPESEGLTELAARKRLLVAQADLHRSVIAISYLQLRTRIGTAQDVVQSNRWWVFGGLAAAGVVFGGQWRMFMRWTPLALAAWRVLSYWWPDSRGQNPAGRTAPRRFR